MGANPETLDGMTARHHVAPGTQRLGNEDVFVLFRLCLDAVPGRGTSHFFVAGEHVGDGKCRSHTLLLKRGHGFEPKPRTALHVEYAGAIRLVAVAPYGQPVFEGAKFVHGIEMAENQNAGSGLAAFAGEPPDNNVAKPVQSGQALNLRAKFFQRLLRQVHHAVDPGSMMGWALHPNPRLDSLKDLLCVECAF